MILPVACAAEGEHPMIRHAGGSVFPFRFLAVERVQLSTLAEYLKSQISECRFQIEKS